MSEGSAGGVPVLLEATAWEGTEADTEALLAEWHVALGDLVSAGQEIGMAELVKASVPIVAAVGGRIVELRVAVGETFARDRVLVLIEPGS